MIDSPGVDLTRTSSTPAVRRIHTCCVPVPGVNSLSEALNTHDCWKNCGVEDMALGELAVDGFITMQLPDKCADSKSN
jgi:hypothetical protein